MSTAMKTARPTHPSGSRQERREAAHRARVRARIRRRVLFVGIPSIVAVAAIVLVVVLGGGGNGTKTAAKGSVAFDGPPRATMLAVGDTIPSWSAPEIRGGTVAWTRFAGSPTLISIWAPWCPHCQVDEPILARVGTDYPGVKTVTVAIWDGQRPGPSSMDFVESSGITFPTAVDDSNDTLAKGFGVEGTPTVYAVDASGTIVAAHSGELGEAGLRTMYQQLSQLAG